MILLGGFSVNGFFTFSGGDKVVIGAVIPLSGSGAFFGEQLNAGMQMALDEINANGGIDGKKLELVLEDSVGDPATAISAYNNLLLKSPLAVITAFSAPSVVLSPLSKQNQVPLLITLASAVDVTLPSEYAFRFFSTSDLDAPIIANYLLDKNYKKFAIIYLNDDYGQTYLKSFSRVVESRGGSVVAQENFLRGTTDVKTQLLKIKSSGAQVLYVVGYDKDYETIFRQVKEMDLKVQLAGNWILANPTVIKLVGENANGAYMTTTDYYLDSKNNSSNFSNKFKEKYSKNADAYSAFGYDSVMILAKTIEQFGSGPEQIKTGLTKIKYAGLLGEISFDKARESNFDLYPAIIENGKVVLIE